MQSLPLMMKKTFMPSSALMAGDKDLFPVQIKKEKLDEAKQPVTPETTSNNAAPRLPKSTPHFKVKLEHVDDSNSKLCVRDNHLLDYPGITKLLKAGGNVKPSIRNLSGTCINKKELNEKPKNSSNHEFSWMSKNEQNLLKLMQAQSAYSAKDIKEILNCLNKKYGQGIENHHFRLFHRNPKLYETKLPSVPNLEIISKVEMKKELAANSVISDTSKKKDSKIPSDKEEAGAQPQNCDLRPLKRKTETVSREIKKIKKDSGIPNDDSKNNPAKRSAANAFSSTSTPVSGLQDGLLQCSSKPGTQKKIREERESIGTSPVSAERQYIRGGELFILIISWKADWLDSADEYPPISDEIRYHVVKNTYSSSEEYASTYFGLHLLSIWYLIKKAYQSEPANLYCTLKSFEEKNFYYKNKCSHVCVEADMPTHQSIILVTYIVNGQHRRLFGYVYEVQAKKYQPSDTDTQVPASLKKALLSFYTHEKIETPLEASIIVQRITKARVLIKQYEALIFGKASALRTTVISPAENRRKIRTLSLLSGRTFAFKMMDPFTDSIVRSVLSYGDLVTLVNKPTAKESCFVLSVVRKFLGKCPILVCFKDMEKLRSVVLKAMILQNNDFACLAVKESEAEIADDLVPFTLRSRAKNLKLPLGHAEKQILQRSKVVFTVLSNVFLGESQTLSPQTVCIIDDAHMVTEAETALILNLMPKNLLLLGTPIDFPELDGPLQSLKYHTSLYHRMNQYSIKENIMLNTDIVKE